MADGPTATFADFAAKFPELELPLTFTAETVQLISNAIPPLPGEMIEQFLIPIEPGRTDELTEFVACLRLPEAEEYVGLVYWRADLLQYHYTLATFKPKSGELIDRQVIAGTSYDGAELTETQALLNETLMIYQVSGQSEAADNFDYRASSSTARRFQVAASGKIVEL